MIEQKIFKALLRRKVCVFQTQSIYYRSYRAGRRQSASAYAAISKIIALQAIFAFLSFCLKKYLLFLSYYSSLYTWISAI